MISAAHQIEMWGCCLFFVLAGFILPPEGRILPIRLFDIIAKRDEGSILHFDFIQLINKQIRMQRCSYFLPPTET